MSLRDSAPQQSRRSTSHRHSFRHFGTVSRSSRPDCSCQCSGLARECRCRFLRRCCRPASAARRPDRAATSQAAGLSTIASHCCTRLRQRGATAMRSACAGDQSGPRPAAAATDAPRARAIQIPVKVEWFRKRMKKTTEEPSVINRDFLTHRFGCGDWAISVRSSSARRWISRARPSLRRRAGQRSRLLPDSAGGGSFSSQGHHSAVSSAAGRGQQPPTAAKHRSPPEAAP
eukprot:SAG31_NODE_9259_length_1307_cov_1.564570_1_plen_231_part_00